VEEVGEEGLSFECGGDEGGDDSPLPKLMALERVVLAVLGRLGSCPACDLLGLDLVRERDGG
jgi:hypothetical protein